MGGKSPTMDFGFFALFFLCFGFLSLLLVGGAIGGALAGALAYGIYAIIPPDDKGRRLPIWMGLLALVVGLMMAGLSFTR
jgi:hypothetical protein